MSLAQCSFISVLFFQSRNVLAETSSVFRFIRRCRTNKLIASAINSKLFGGNMQFNDDILMRYLSIAPVPLALERVLESRIHMQHDFTQPILNIKYKKKLLTKTLFANPMDTDIDPNPQKLAHTRELSG